MTYMQALSDRPVHGRPSSADRSDEVSTRTGTFARDASEPKPLFVSDMCDIPCCFGSLVAPLRNKRLQRKQLHFASCYSRKRISHTRTLNSHNRIGTVWDQSKPYAVENPIKLPAAHGYRQLIVSKSRVDIQVANTG